LCVIGPIRCRSLGVHQLAQWRDPIGCYLARHEPLAGPRRGAELAG
jgi:hypothetical protein